MNVSQIEMLVQTANQEQRLWAEFADQISPVNQQLKNLRVEPPEVETYQRVAVQQGAPPCETPLHIVKSDFTGIRARSLLVSHNTVLNFKGILDCSYADKISWRLSRQGLASFRQGDQARMQCYDEVKRKLTLVTNKYVMTYDDERATCLIKIKKIHKGCCFSSTTQRG